MPHLWGKFCGLKGEKSTHNLPSRPRRGVVGPNIDRCIISLKGKEICAYRKECAYKRVVYDTAHFSGRRSYRYEALLPLIYKLLLSL